MRKISNDRLKQVSFSKSQFLAFALIFSVIGGYSIYKSLAAPANFNNDVVITGVNEPTNMVFTPDGRMLILGRRGTIWVVQPGGTQVNATPFLQLPAGQVAFDNERGLLGLALDPNFSSNGFYYVYYTQSSNLKNKVSRFTAVGNSTNTNTETTIWQEAGVSDIYHQGGQLAFGPDGYLYISVGDHLSSATAQQLTSQQGKILRISSDGSIPTDNPFYDGTGPNKDDIWAMGFRNPFRFSFDQVSGKIYEGDVGENTTEEVNIVTKGANYGWPTCEGSCGTSGMTNPIYSYNHNGRDASITGGFVYRANQFPSTYQGAYFFADYAQNWIKYLSLDANGNSTGVHNFEPIDGSSDGPYGDPVALVPGPDGSLYYVDIGPFQTTNTGSIHRISYALANLPPVARSAATPTSGNTAPLTVNFSSAGSSDPENQTLSYSWDFGDSTSSTLANPSHTYNSRGSYTAKLTVSDGVNQVISPPLTITVGRPPVPSISLPANNSTFVAGQQISFAGSATDPEDGTITGGNLSWTVVFHHAGHIHPGPGPFTGSSGSFNMPTSGHDFTGTTSYEITLTATDSDGIKTSTSVFILPQKVNLTFNANQTGASTVLVDGITQTMPVTIDSLIGFSHTIDVATPQVIGSTRYKFSSWSDGGAKSHSITVPGQDLTLTANFVIDNSLPAGLVAAYPLDEGSGTTTVDISGNLNLATLNSATWTTAGKYGNALSLNGTFASAPSSGSLNLGNAGTIEAWVKLSTINQWHGIIAKGNANTDSAHNYSLEVNSSNQVACVLGNGSNSANATTSTALAAGIFYHLACSWDGSTLKAYINGVQAASIAQSVVPAANSSPLFLGQFGASSDFMNGILDDVRIYNVALTASDILADSSTPVSGGGGTGKLGDLNNDNSVNILDLSILLSHYGQAATASQGDINNDGVVTITDLSILLSKWGS